MGKSYKEDNAEEPKVARPELLDAFEQTYRDAVEEYYADRVFDYAAIRQYFGCMQIPNQEDQLHLYVEALEQMGFRFRTTWDGQPAIFVKLKQKVKRNCPALFSSDEQQQALSMLDGPEPVQLPDQVNVLDVRSDKDFVMFPKDLEPLREIDREIMEA